MVRQSKQSPPRYWAKNQAEVAAFFGVQPKTVEQWRKKGMPGNSPAWPLDEIAQWLRQAGPWKPRAATAKSGNGDPLMAGPSEGSEGLERYRKARAALAELDLAERNGVMINRALMRESMARAAAPLRTAGEKLNLRFNEEARQILDEGLDEFLRAATEFLADVEPNEDAEN